MSLLLQIDILYKIIINTLTVSIREETFIVMFVLIFMGNFRYLETDIPGERKIKLGEIKNIAVCSVIPAIFFSIARYVNIDFFIYFPLGILIMYLLLLFVHDLKSNVKDFVKTFFFLAVALIVIYIIQLSYMPLIEYITEKPIEEINSDLLRLLHL